MPTFRPGDVVTSTRKDSRAHGAVGVVKQERALPGSVVVQFGRTKTMLAVADLRKLTTVHDMRRNNCRRYLGIVGPEHTNNPDGCGCAGCNAEPHEHREIEKRIAEHLASCDVCQRIEADPPWRF